MKIKDALKRKKASKDTASKKKTTPKRKRKVYKNPYKKRYA